MRDISVEAEVAKFLDKYFYNKVPEIIDFIRYKDKNEQLKGKDVRFSWNELTDIVVDEKAISHYINKNIPTFAFEIGFGKTSNRTEGWLFNLNKETEYYLLIWIWAKRNWNPSSEDITKLECLLVKRNDIINFLNKEGFTEEVIKGKEQEIIKDGISGAIDKGKHPYVYFYYTTRLVEKPFNVIIRKEKLKDLALKRIIVTKEKCEVL